MKPKYTLVEVTCELGREMIAAGLAVADDDCILTLTDLGKQVVDDYIERRRQACS